MLALDLVQTVVHALRLDASLHPQAQAAGADVMRALGAVWQWIAQADGWTDGVLRLAHGLVPDELARADKSCSPTRRMDRSTPNASACLSR